MKLSWRCWDRGDGRYALAAETMERDPDTGEFYGAATAFSKINYCELELKVAVAKLERAFEADYRFEENRNPELSWYRSIKGWN